MDPNSARVRHDQRPELLFSSSGDERYLVAYDLTRVEKASRFGIWNWKRILCACAVGVLLGLGVAAIEMTGGSPAREIIKGQTESQPESSNQASFQTEVQEPKPSAPIEAAEAGPELSRKEAARLRARNRRLEALVSVLRQRAHVPEKKSAQDQTSYIGQ